MNKDKNESFDKITVRNCTGTDLTALRPILALQCESGLIVTVDSVATGSSPEVGGRFAVLFGGVTEGKRQVGVSSGLAWVRVLVNDESHLCADVEGGNVTRLQTVVSGSAMILKLLASECSDDSEDERWALVKLMGASG